MAFMSDALFTIKERVYVVTGATGALAGAVTRQLLGAGAHVVLIGRSQEKLDAAVAKLPKDGGKALGLPCDVTDAEGAAQVRDQVLSELGRIDGLVNGAGGNMPGAVIKPEESVFDLKLEDYDGVMKLNLHGTLIPSLAFGEHFARQGHGAIVNFSSASSTHALTRVLGYSNAKAAVDNLTRWMATEFAHKYGDKLRVNAVCPGFFVGEQNRRLLLNEDGSLTARGQQIVNQTPMQRFGEAEEVSGAVHFLLSDAARFITGQVINIDGCFGIYSGV